MSQEFETNDDSPLPRAPINLRALVNSAMKPQSEAKKHAKPGAPFKCLGHDGGNYYFLPVTQGQVVAMEAGKMSARQLLTLAPLKFWEKHYGQPGKPPQWMDAVNALIERCGSIGIYDPAKIRGRGAWLDDGKLVFNTGDNLVIGDRQLEFPDFDSDFTYERRNALEIDWSEPAGTAEASRLLEVCARLPWKSPLCGDLLAGWCMVAPICGILPWRSHIWLSGSAGSGKTWTVDHIVQPLLGNVVLKVQSSSTEAGLRQAMKSDALPILFDEAESEDKRGQERMQRVLELARQASSEKGASIVKGSAGGVASCYLVRSCFAFVSIGVAAIHRADLSRITRLDFRHRSGSAGLVEFDALKKMRDEVFDQPGFCSRIRARALSQAVYIRQNATVFARAVTAKVGDQRLGDQLGSLMAGAYALLADGTVSPEAALAWVESKDWRGFGPEGSERDEVAALNELLGASIDFDRVYRSIGEVIRIALKGDEASLAARDAHEALARHGVKIDLDRRTLLVSNSHSQLRRVFENTAWNKKWKDQLVRLPGAEEKNSVRFDGATHRAVEIPLRLVTGEPEAQSGRSRPATAASL